MTLQPRSTCVLKPLQLRFTDITVTQHLTAINSSTQQLQTLMRHVIVSIQTEALVVLTFVSEKALFYIYMGNAKT